VALAVALPAPTPSFAQHADDIGQGRERKVKKLKRLIGRSVVHGQIAVPEAFRYIFGAIATTGDRRTETVMGWARILAHLTGTVDQELLARNEYLATVREHWSAFQYLSCGIYRTSRHTSDIDSPSSRRSTKRRRSSITELAFHGIYTSRVKSAGKCSPCVRYEMEPMSRAAHIGYLPTVRSF
jgi:hypothetical protein